MSGTRFALSPSWILAAVIIALHAAAAASLAAVVPGLAGAALAALLLALGLAAARARALLAARRSVRALELSGAELLVELKNGERLPAALGERRHVSRVMVTLPLLRPARRTLLVTRDMLGAEEFRRLRIWALWNRLPARLVAGKQLQA